MSIKVSLMKQFYQLSILLIFQHEKSFHEIDWKRAASDMHCCLHLRCSEEKIFQLESLLSEIWHWKTWKFYDEHWLHDYERIQESRRQLFYDTLEEFSRAEDMTWKSESQAQILLWYDWF